MFLRLFLLPVAALLLTAAAPQDRAPAEIRANLETIEKAALSGDTKAAAALLADDFVLISQSGKVYARDIALQDLASGFTSWVNSEISVQLEGSTAVVVLVNRRQRTGLPEGSFRVMQLWRQREGRWVLVAQSSARIS